MNLTVLSSNAPQPGDIQITYHPHSKQGVKVMTPEEFKQGIKQANSMEPPDEQPWLPFHSKEDFEFAEIIHEAAMNESQANALIKLIHHCQKNPGSFTLGNYGEVKSTWETASNLLTKVSIISINYTRLSVLILWF